MIVSLQHINAIWQPLVISTLQHRWGHSHFISRGRTYTLPDLEGFVAADGDNIVGLVVFKHTEAQQSLEIISIDSFQEGVGIGSMLLNAALQIARQRDCRNVCLVTTNDNLPAIRFYKNRDFSLKKVHYYAVSEARKSLPEIPLVGYQDIPILHEMEFEYSIS